MRMKRSMIKVVIDTNVLVSALSSKSIHHWLIQALLNEQFLSLLLMKYYWNTKRY
jgi:predicted nucleic acid-binding protein